MFAAAFKLFLSAFLIAFSSWLSHKKPVLAGFIAALPIATLLMLPFSYVESQDRHEVVEYARSILVAVPLSCLFFVPFLFADRVNWGFWGLYGSGVALLAAGYLAHAALMRQF